MDNSHWFKDAVIYELHVRSFYDSLGDGMGDFGGLTQKLDYLQDLGITAIWLLPFYPSPLKDDGYDIADYQNIHPQYGTLDSFREFLDAAHQRGLKVITELVLNHTSDQHPWFQRARRAPPGSPERDFYVWSDTPDRYAGVPIIFKDFENSNWAYDNVARAYYWHRFYSHQPDLNFDNPAVMQAMLPIVDFWFELGVDGMRLDAVPYLYEREGTTCAGLPETHTFLRELRAHIDARFPNRMLLAEANVWPEEAVTYFGDGDQCHMAFHFPVMPRLYMAMSREDRFPIVDIMQQTPAIPDSCQWALFLRNHDELTLEMVTDEERDSMYRAYAHDSQARINMGIRRRLAPLLSNNRRRIELMNGLLFSLPGTPVIYYGDEIGMGDNIFLGDRNSVRTPMQWSADRNAGFSRANPQKLFLPVTVDPEYHYEAFNVDAQQNNSQSLLWWMKRLIDIRKRTPAFSRGSLAFLHPANRTVLAFLRHHEEQTVLVLANLSRFVQCAHLDLSAFDGYIPVELFGGARFPPIGKAPYLMMLGPHTFCWFELCASVPEQVCPLPARTLEEVATLAVRKSWTEVATREDDAWERLLTRFLECRLLGGAAAPMAISHVTVRDWLLLPATSSLAETLLLFIDVQQPVGEPQRIALPLTFAAEPHSVEVLAHQPGSVLSRIEGGQVGILFDPLADPEYAVGLLHLLAEPQSLRSRGNNDLIAWLNAPLSDAERSAVSARPRLIESEQFNVSAVFDDRLVLKLLTHVGEGPHPDVEFGQFFARCRQPCSVAKLRGAIELRGRRQPPITLAVLHEFVVNEADAWQYTLDVLSVFFERVVTCEPQTLPPEYADWRQLIELPRRSALAPDSPDELLGEYLDVIRSLARRTAELHVALASDPNDPTFAPEAFSQGYQRSIYQAMRGLALDVLDTLQQSLDRLSNATRPQAEMILRLRSDVLKLLNRVSDEPFDMVRIRCHGDYHLGQVLFTGSDCVIIDFEGKPHIPLTERRIKRSPLRDVSCMLRSLDYASRAALTGLASGRGRTPGQVRTEDLPRIVPWVRVWQGHVTAEFLTTYLAHPGIANLLPKSARGVRVLLDAFLMERCLVEVAHELRDRPDWLPIALESTLAHIAAAVPDNGLRV